MIIISATSKDEAADLAEILGHHLVWAHKIYLLGPEYVPEQQQQGAV